MSGPELNPERSRLAVRCDGGGAVGAGHVARCLPLADAFARRGWSVAFVGRFEGLAAWLIERAGLRTESPVAGIACGVEPARWTAGIVDSYVLDAAEVCELAAQIPIATLAEAMRCDEAGILIDYHLDRVGRPPSRGSSPARPTRRSTPRLPVPGAPARRSRRCWSRSADQSRR